MATEGVVDVVGEEGAVGVAGAVGAVGAGSQSRARLRSSTRRWTSIS
jgi:hypothetical protein